MSATKFYHYNVWIEGEDGDRMNPLDVTQEEVFLGGLLQNR